MSRIRWCAPRSRWVVGVLLLGGCGDATGPDGNLAVAFRLADSPFVSSMTSDVDPALSLAAIPLTGTNGTLQLDGLQLIVRDFEFRRAEDLCPENDDGFRAKCRKVELLPQLITVPMDAEQAAFVSATLPAGLYRKIEFKTDRLKDDLDGAVTLAQIREQIEDWPRRASVYATGTFQPTDGEVQPFRVFFEAEAEIEMRFDPPLSVDETMQVVEVVLDPAAWFTREDGSVTDLSAFDFDVTRAVVKFDRSWFERGIVATQFN